MVSMKPSTYIVKVHDPLDRGSGHEVGPVWPHGENVKEFYKYFFLYF